jgi:1,4-alpha-glucan branching enzyme
VGDLNRAYRSEKALYEQDVRHGGFEWVDANDANDSILTFLRFSADFKEAVLVVVNFTPVTRFGYRIGVPWGGWWAEMLNSDSPLYAGSGQGNLGGLTAQDRERHGRPFSLEATVPGLSVMYFKGKRA